MKRFLRKLMRLLFQIGEKQEQEMPLGRSLYMMSDGVRFSVKSKKRKKDEKCV